MSEQVYKLVRAMNRWAAYGVGILLLAGVAFIIADVVMRRFGSSLGGADEISGYLMALASTWGMGYAAVELAHVRIDVLRSLARPPVRALFDVLALLSMTATVWFITYKAWPVVSRSLDLGSRSNSALELPLWMVQVPWFAGWVWFSLTLLMICFSVLVAVVQGGWRQTEPLIGIKSELESE